MLKAGISSFFVCLVLTELIAGTVGSGGPLKLDEKFERQVATSGCQGVPLVSTYASFTGTVNDFVNIDISLAANETQCIAILSDAPLNKTRVHGLIKITYVHSETHFLNSGTRYLTYTPVIKSTPNTHCVSTSWCNYGSCGKMNGHDSNEYTESTFGGLDDHGSARTYSCSTGWSNFNSCGFGDDRRCNACVCSAIHDGYSPVYLVEPSNGSRDRGIITSTYEGSTSNIQASVEGSVTRVGFEIAEQEFVEFKVLAKLNKGYFPPHDFGTITCIMNCEESFPVLHSVRREREIDGPSVGSVQVVNMNEKMSNNTELLPQSILRCDSSSSIHQCVAEGTWPNLEAALRSPDVARVNAQTPYGIVFSSGEVSRFGGKVLGLKQLDTRIDLKLTYHGKLPIMSVTSSIRPKITSISCAKKSYAMEAGGLMVKVHAKSEDAEGPAIIELSGNSSSRALPVYLRNTTQEYVLKGECDTTDCLVVASISSAVSHDEKAVECHLKIRDISQNISKQNTSIEVEIDSTENSHGDMTGLDGIFGDLRHLNFSRMFSTPLRGMVSALIFIAPFVLLYIVYALVTIHRTKRVDIGRVITSTGNGISLSSAVRLELQRLGLPNDDENVRERISGNPVLGMMDTAK